MTAAPPNSSADGRPHGDEQIDAVQQRAAQAAALAEQLGFGAAAARVAGVDPHGHGFVEATSMNRAGYTAALLPADDGHPAVLERLAQASSTLRGNSASSSRNSTP